MSAIWSAGCAAGLFFDLVFPHPASPAGNWRRRIDGSPHARDAIDELDGVSLPGFSPRLVAFPAGSFPPAGGRGAGSRITARCRRIDGSQPAARSGLEMNATRFLIAAYVATWLIHGGYILSLVRRFRQLRQQMKELGKQK